jgi:hypothetical protein
MFALRTELLDCQNTADRSKSNHPIVPPSVQRSEHEETVRRGSAHAKYVHALKSSPGVLNQTVQGLLMKKAQAEAEFKKLKKALKPTCVLPMNKQKGDKKTHAFLTCMVNMLVERNIEGAPCDYDPRSLTTMTQDLMPLRTLARRVDGAFPPVVNPIAIWEIKEYYYTTTFGSRVADGVYETLLDGLELFELEAAAKRKVHHLLVVDDHFTWWKCGRSYLCRIIDMLHMGYVDEVIFGREVLARLPIVVREWKKAYEDLPKAAKEQASVRIARKPRKARKGTA